MKEKRERRCEWCGTKMIRDVCARGPFCAKEQRNSEELMARIEKEKKEA